MPEQDDPFTGTWRFSAARSKLSTPLPRSWVQTIVASWDEIVIHENIIRSDGSRAEVRPIAGCIAHDRVDSHSITGSRKKNGVVAPTETLTVAPNGGVLTLIYSVQTGASPVARGIAVFQKDVTAIRSFVRR
jgi:hypothetical protein